MMGFCCEERGTLSLALLVLLVLFQLCPDGGAALELNPSTSEVILSPNASFTVLCSGWSRVTWKLPQEPPLDGVLLDNQGTRSVLQLHNVTWRHSGSYVCEEPSSDQAREVDVFIPGEGPDEWFVPVGPGVVTKESEEGTIPCVVSDPRLNVTLYERPGRLPVNGTTYHPGRGFTGPLKDSSYVCVASMGALEKESQVFYVFSIVVPKTLDAVMTVSSSVLRQGEVLTVNCTVKDVEMVFFTWDFPRRQEFEPLTDFLPNRIRSFVNISTATLDDSGVYICTVQETVQGKTVMKNVTITVLERGYIDVLPVDSANISALLHETVELSLQIDAYPAPSVTWTRDNGTVSGDTAVTSTTPITERSYLSTLTLVRVRMEQRGRYTATIANDDEVREVVFDLQVTAPPRITELSDQHVAQGQAVLCVTEGVPTPTVLWYSCHSTLRCGNKTVAWQSLSADSEGVSLQQNITNLEERGVSQVRSLLTLQTMGSVTAVRCEARNERGRRAWDIRLVSNSLFSQVAVLAAVLALVVIAVIFLIILIVLWRKKPRYEVRWKVIESVSSDGHEYTYVDPTQLPYHSAWEVPRDSLVLGHTLGSGAFGRVVEATAYGLLHSQSTTKVAVKMLKSTARRSESQALISELKILSHLGPNLNVVNLLGACTKGGPIYLITEYCRHGDLVDYLHRNKHTYLQSDAEGTQRENNTPGKSDSDGGYMDMSKEECVQYVAMQELVDHIKYADIEPAVYETPYQEPGQEEQETSALSLSDSPLLNLNDLLGFSYQVAQGMDFLSSKNCVHRDLAARNVLVCEGKLVKICDFGLARDIMNDENYIAKGNTFLPVKWMAPESIFQNVYTSLSDVWSYGILLWEIFSLGGSPYPDIPMNDQFYAALKRGYRMPKPTHATQQIHEVMSRCWEEKDDVRPPFSSLSVSIGNMLSDGYKKRYLQVTENFLSGEHPAVSRSKPSPAPRPAGTADEVEVEAGAEVELEVEVEAQAADDDGSHTPQIRVHQSEAEPEEAGPSSTTYVIPVTDVTIETSGQVLDTATPELSSKESEVLLSLRTSFVDEEGRVNPQLSDVPAEKDTHDDASEPQEVTSQPNQEAEDPPQIAGPPPCTTTEEEESFL